MGSKSNNNYWMKGLNLLCLAGIVAFLVFLSGNDIVASSEAALAGRKLEEKPTSSSANVVELNVEDNEPESSTSLPEVNGPIQQEQDHRALKRTRGEMGTMRRKRDIFRQSSKGSCKSSSEACCVPLGNVTAAPTKSMRMMRMRMMSSSTKGYSEAPVRRYILYKVKLISYFSRD